MLRQDPALELAPGSATTPASATEERAVCPFPNGQDLLSINANGNGSLWPVSTTALATHACVVAGRNLTREERSRFITGYKYSPVCS